MNKTNESKMTILHAAVKCGNVAVCTLVKMDKRFTKVHALTGDGQTARDLAETQGNDTLIELLPPGAHQLFAAVEAKDGDAAKKCESILKHP